MNRKIIALAAVLACSAIAQAYAATVYRIPFVGMVASASSSGSSGSSSTGGAPPDPNGPTTIQLNHCDGAGNVGPTMAGCQTAYVNIWPGSSFSVTNGIQHWTVPQTGTYQLQAIGASGGLSLYCYDAGQPASLRVTMTLTVGQVLDMVVGQIGTYGGLSGSGGGASTISSGGVPLLVAGGGGGCVEHGTGYNAQASKGYPGTGAGGQNPEAGAGYYGDAPSGTNAGQAMAFVHGAAGSSGGPSYGAVPGGFGGGGGGGVKNWGGGGGGYDGGNAGGVGGDSYWSPLATYVSGGIENTGTVYGSIMVIRLGP